MTCEEQTFFASLASRTGILSLQLLHHALNQFLRVGEALHYHLHVHDRLAGPALALAVDAVLADQGHGVGDQVHGDRETAAGHAHHGLVMLEFFVLVFEYRHGSIVTWRAVGDNWRAKKQLS